MLFPVELRVDLDPEVLVRVGPADTLVVQQGRWWEVGLAVWHDHLEALLGVQLHLVQLAPSGDAVGGRLEELAFPLVAREIYE